MRLRTDVIMLAKGDNYARQQMTQRAIDSIRASAKTEGVDVHIIVVETMDGVNYENVDVMVHLDEDRFKYNLFTKAGLAHMREQERASDTVLFVNNDIIALPGFLLPLIHALGTYDSVSPANPRQPDHRKLKARYTEGFGIWQPSVFCGWAFMMRRSTVDSIGWDTLFPDEIEAWYSDNNVCDVLQENSCRHALVRASKIEHLQSVTLASLNRKEKDHYTNQQHKAYLSAKAKRHGGTSKTT